MRKIWEDYRWIPATAVGSAVFALGFSLFLQPNEISPGGISGLALVAVELLGYGSVGVLTILINLPLFILGGVKIGRRFFCGSLLGMVLSSILIDAFAKITMPPMDSLLSIVQMPGGIPVATTAVGNSGATNAGLLAVQMLSAFEPELADKLEDYRNELKEKVAESNAQLV